MKRTCTKCKCTYDLNEQHFYRNALDKQGFRVWCKTCADHAVKVWMQNKDARKKHTAHCQTYQKRMREYHYANLSEVKHCEGCNTDKQRHDFTALHRYCRDCDKKKRKVG